MSEPPRERFGELRRRFEELVDLPEPMRAERFAGLAAEDPALAEELEKLLAADAVSGALLDAPAAEAARALVADWVAGGSSAPAAGARVGAWRLVEPLGRGGMGEVWTVERADGQFQQRAALKLLQRGMDSEAILARFRRERQILARLSHPGIARLLDGGIAEDGRPYFVLERVEGLPLTERARVARLPIAERLRLVIAACDAVDSAHRQLVVHRDLKPSNILVTAAGEVRLLDFGIAKVLGDEADDERATLFGPRAFTPAYAAPEQILGEAVTTATDVWGLGAVLHELLSGRLPHRRSTRSEAALAAEVERETPPRLAAVARQVGAEELARLGLPEREARRLPRLLGGDLETIVGRALERFPERRYPSARALADDLLRHLEGRPVRARRPSRVYLAARFVRRHRLGVAAAAAALLSLLAGLSIAVWQAERAAATAREAAASARRAERTRDFLISLFEVADPMRSGGERVSARDLLAQGARRLERELSGEPALRADLLEAIARIQASAGALEAAERSISLALAERGETPGARAAAEATLGAIRIQQGDLDGAAELLGRALAALGRAGAPALALARVESDLAQVEFWRKRTAAAEAMERRALATYERELGPEHVETAIHRRNLGTLLDDLGRLDEAEAAYRESQRVLEASLGPDHPHLAQSHLNLAVLIDRRGRGAEAEELYRRALELRRRALGDDHVQTAQTLQLLAHFYVSHDRFDEAEAAGREALAIFRAVNPDHFEVGKCLNGLGVVAARRGQPAAAEALYREALASFEISLGRGHPFFWWTSGSLSQALAAQGRLASAEALQREVLAALEEISGAESADAQWGHELLAETLKLAGRAGESEAEAARARAIAARLAGGA